MPDRFRRLFCTSLILAVLISACQSPPSTLLPTVTQGRFATLEAPAQRVTLPPTWTPSFTPRPSATFTPTPTPLPTDTPGPDAICDQFRVLYAIPEGERFPWTGSIPILAGVEQEAVVIRFALVNRKTGENKVIDLPAARGMVVTELPVRLLPGPGLYDWTLGIFSEAYGDLCTQSGTLRALRPRAEVEVTAADVPDSP